MTDITRPSDWLRRRAVRRGFTLVEAMMASAILLGVVTAVTSAIIAGQQHALEAEIRIAAAMAAESKMNELAAEDYAELSSHHGSGAAVGEMLDEQGDPLPPLYSRLGPQRGSDQRQPCVHQPERDRGGQDGGGPHLRRRRSNPG